MHEVIEAAERAVNKACRELRITADEARTIIRAEVSYDTILELRGSEAGRDMSFNWHEAMRRRQPLKYRGVSYFLVEDMTPKWRVVGIGAGARLHLVEPGERQKLASI